MKTTFTREDLEYAEWQRDLRQLKFERAIKCGDYELANIACAQKAYWDFEIERIRGLQ